MNYLSHRQFGCESASLEKPEGAQISQMVLGEAFCQPGTSIWYYWTLRVRFSSVWLKWLKLNTSKRLNERQEVAYIFSVSNFSSIQGLRLYARHPSTTGKVLGSLFFHYESRLITPNSCSLQTEKWFFEMYAFVGLYSFVHITNYKVISIISIHLNRQAKEDRTIYYSDKQNQHFLIMKMQVILFSCTSV